MTVTLLAAVGRNGVIGRAGDLPWHLPEDLRHFKAVTMGHTMVMGRRTFDSIGRALPGRRTIVVTRQAGWTAHGVTVTHSLEQALAAAGAGPDAGDGRQVFVVGGGEVYAQALPLADRLLLTEVDQSPEGDAWFPDVDPVLWKESGREPHDGYAFVTYTRGG